MAKFSPTTFMAPEEVATITNYDERGQVIENTTTPAIARKLEWSSGPPRYEILRALRGHGTGQFYDPKNVPLEWERKDYKLVSVDEEKWKHYLIFLQTGDRSHYRISHRD